MLQLQNKEVMEGMGREDGRGPLACDDDGGGTWQLSKAPGYGHACDIVAAKTYCETSTYYTHQG